MVLLKNREPAENTWTLVEDDASIPAAGDVIVGVSRWIDERSSIEQREGRVGVLLHGDDNVRALAGEILDRPLIAIAFPKFVDGRGYSLARILRDELHYKGELRAVGDILRDQLYYLDRVGFDALEVNEDVKLEHALSAFRDFSVTYQPAADIDTPLFRRAELAKANAQEAAQ